MEEKKNGNGNGNGNGLKVNGSKQNGFNQVLESLMEGAQGVLTSRTVVGEPITVGDTIIIPLSDVSIGVGAGSNGADRKDGGMGDKCMFAAYCTPEDFYNAMLEIGGEPWNTTTDKIADGEFTDGQKVDVTLTWDGQDTPVDMVDSVKAADGAFDVDMRFSGNLQNNKDCGSGCIACLNSCWAGVTSNAAYGYNAIDSGEVSAFLNDSVMPEDGTDVQLTFTLK